MLVKPLVKSVFDVCEELGVDPTRLTIDINQYSIDIADTYMFIGRQCENYKDVYDTLKEMKEGGTLRYTQHPKCGKCKTCKCSK